MSVATDPGTSPPERYDGRLAADIEARWQRRWLEQGTFVVPRVTEGDKFYLLDMFPYPSGEGLHVGHPLGYIATDVFGRFLRMRGRRVLHTLGFDAFGLPAEQYAVQTGTHPRTTTESNIARYREQIGRLGLAHDPTRSIATTDPGFYRWTQWIFLQIYNAWYDEELGTARPISALVDAYASGRLTTPDGRPWSELSSAEQAALLDARRLAYRAKVPVNWCPGLGTVLANEEVTAEGRSERGNYPVFRRELTQWMMRITAYADRLLADLDLLDWPESVKTMQRNWIGRSDGATIRFPVVARDETIEVFTTRPDTLFGATYMVLAPELDLVDRILPDGWPATNSHLPPGRWTGGAASPAEAVEGYRRAASRLSELERQEAARAKTGVFTGAFAHNPATGENMPIFIADYVMAGYGTGAIMAVPAHDQRDFEFAREFGLPLRQVVTRPDAGAVETWPDAWTAEGTAVNSANDEVSLDGLATEAAKAQTVAWLERSGAGAGAVTYKLRDWLFSRQRYWGEPFPIVYDEDGLAHALPESMLPVELPEVRDYRPTLYDPDDADTEPEAPLARAGDWLELTADLGEGPRRYRRETNTMPQWAGSCWYELRYLDPDNDEQFVAPDLEQFWMGPRREGDPGGVDLYVGGVEHAVLHLLYSRFWHKVLFDLGHLSSREPFRRLFNQGYIQAYAYQDSRGVYVPAEKVDERQDGWYYLGERVERSYGKMGKSLKNSVTPDEMASRYGADTLRLYEMSMGPLDVSRPWETRAVIGSLRFLQRVWRNLLDEQTGKPTVADEPADPDTMRVLHATIDGVTRDFEGLRMNTAAAKLIELNNHLTGLPAVPRPVAEALVLMLAPLAPHVSEELWARLGHADSLAYEPFPIADPAWLVRDLVRYPVQINGRVRATVEMAATAGADTVEREALAHPNIRTHLEGMTVSRVVVVPGRIVNIVAR